MNLRYRMRFERAMGLTFDMQRLAAREPSGAAGAFDSLTDAPAVLREQLRFNTAGVEFYQLFDTREPVTKLLSAGFGLVQTSARLSNGETQFPIAGDGFYLSAGAGIEKFVWRSWAWDSGLRYMAIFHDGTVNHDVQLHTGFIFGDHQGFKGTHWFQLQIRGLSNKIMPIAVVCEGQQLPGSGD